MPPTTGNYRRLPTTAGLMVTIAEVTLTEVAEGMEELVEVTEVTLIEAA